MSASGFECGPDLGHTQGGRLQRARSTAQNCQGVTVVQIVERLQRARVVLAQRRTQRIGVPVGRPDQILMCPSQDLDRLAVSGVTGNPAVVVAVGAHQIG